jgi:sec-independent protein translocase protein TatA
MGIENPVHLLFIAAVALVVLGPRRLPRLARALGDGIREFRQALEEGGVSRSEHDPPAEAVGPTEPIPSPDAPDRRPL